MYFTYKNYKKNAFTLAEVLITLAVIGVVAALAIPSLLNDTNKAENKTAMKKVYAEFSSSTNIIIQEKGGSLLGQFDDANDILNAYQQKLSVQKTCSLGNANGVDKCFHGAVKLLNDTDYPHMGQLAPRSTGLVLNNGMLVLFFGGAVGVTKTCTVDGVANRCGMLWTDVNGWKGPNKLGMDLFAFTIAPQKMTPLSLSGQTCIYPTKAGWDGVNNSGWNCSSIFLME